MQERDNGKKSAPGSFLRNAEPVRWNSVSKFIMNKIIQGMLDGELRPGDKLPTEAELSTHFGAGRNSVREAIKMLSAIGAIQIRRGEGTFVADTLSEEMLNPLILSLVFAQGNALELMEIRLVLETAAAGLVARKASAADIKELQQANERLLREARRGTHEGHVLRDLDMDFHRVFYRITRNRLLIKISDAIYSLFHASIEQTVDADPELAYRNHQKIIDALQKNATEHELQDAIQQSLSYWEKYVSRIA